MEAIHRVAAEGKTVLIVIHDLATAARYCDELIALGMAASRPWARPGLVQGAAGGTLPTARRRWRPRPLAGCFGALSPTIEGHAVAIACAEPRGRVTNPRDISISDDSRSSPRRQPGPAIDNMGARSTTSASGSTRWSSPGATFVLSYLIMDVAHRFGDELLLWDSWGAMPLPGTPIDFGMGDALAELVRLADRGDPTAEHTLRDMYEIDNRVHVGDEVLRFSPRG